MKNVAKNRVKNLGKKRGKKRFNNLLKNVLENVGQKRVEKVVKDRPGDGGGRARQTAVTISKRRNIECYEHNIAQEGSRDGSTHC